MKTAHLTALLGVTRILIAVVASMYGSASFAQQAADSSMAKAQQVPLSGRAEGSGVKAQQSASASGADSSVDTVNSTVDVSGVYAGSTPDPDAPRGPLTLTIADAVRRGLRFNLGVTSASSAVDQARGDRLAAISQLLPNIYGTLTATDTKTYLPSQGLTSGVFGPTALPATIGPFHYYAALVNIGQSFSVTSVFNARQSQASTDSARKSVLDARELITLAVAGTYLRVLASKANVASQEAQVKQAQATFKQSESQFVAGTKPIIDRNRSFVEFHMQQQRLSSLRGDLAKQTMQLARLIGLPVGQVLTLSEALPGAVPGDVVSVEEAVKAAFAGRSDLEAARLQVKAARAARNASIAEYLPSLGVNGYYGAEGVSASHGAQVFQATGTITVPIFEGLRAHADVQRADAAVARREAEYADQKGVVELDVRQAYVDLGVASEQIAVARDNRKVAAETLTQSLDRFMAGVTDSVEVVQSQETVAMAERDYISSLFSLNLARISLARATGGAERFVPQMLRDTGKQP